MSAKPITLPVWATGGAIATPSGGKQSTGWVTGERPPAQYLNWYQNLVYLWVLFVSGFFTNNGSATGNADLGNTAEANTVPLILARDYLQNRRSHVDHNGYRMGQVTELDETWMAPAAVNVNIPMEAGIPVFNINNWTYSTGGTGNPVYWQYSNASGATAAEVDFSLCDLVPPNAIITGVIVECNRLNTTDTVQVTIATTQANAATRTAIVANGILSGAAAGNATVTLATGTTTGHLPFQMPTGGQGDNVTLALSCGDVAASTIKFFGVRVTYIIPPLGWTYVGGTTNVISAAAAGDQFAYADAQTGLNQRALQLFGSALGGSPGSGAMVSFYETFLDTTTVYETEYMVKPGVITDGSNHRQFFLGVKSAAGVFVGMYSDATLTNWQLRIGAANTDTGVVVASSAVYRVRLEVLGTAMNSSGTTKVRLWINGTKTEVNVAITADKFQQFFSAGTNSTTGGPYDFTVGRVRRCWNHVSSGDNL